jgi:hypothetical protein
MLVVPNLTPLRNLKLNAMQMPVSLPTFLYTSIDISPFFHLWAPRSLAFLPFVVLFGMRGVHMYTFTTKGETMGELDVDRVEHVGDGRCWS